MLLTSKDLLDISICKTRNPSTIFIYGISNRSKSLILKVMSIVRLQIQQFGPSTLSKLPDLLALLHYLQDGESVTFASLSVKLVTICILWFES